MLVAFAACAACASGGTGSDDGDVSGTTEGTAGDAVAADTSRQPAPESGSGAAGSDTGASDDSSSGSMSDSGSSSDAAEDSSEGAAPGDSSVADTGASLDTGSPDTAVLDAALDGDAGCSTGPTAAYQQTCTTCSISVTCLLSCASCTKRDGTQNANPTLQLPCPGTMSVQNIDGNLQCM